jgi:UDP-2,3-diacylglucosamine hydrolase
VRAVFASDVHLAAERPARSAEFFALLDRVREEHADLWLLGDVVEFWPGDDDDLPLHRAVVAALAATTGAGCRVHVTRGNRDFLLGERFAAETGVELLDDYTLLELGGERVVLTHGDLLCTRDVKYQEFRRFVREPANQQRFLGLPLEERRRIAAQTREGTQSSMAGKAADIMDVDDGEVLRVLRAFDADVLIHGHTHRPDVHRIARDGRAATRYVLGDWYEAGRILRWEDGRYALRAVAADLGAR